MPRKDSSIRRVFKDDLERELATKATKKKWKDKWKVLVFEDELLWRKKILQAVKARAKMQNKEFNLTLDDITVPEFCPVFGIPLNIASDRRDFVPSLDRIDNSKGYIKGNICMISGRANRMKSDASPQELQQLAAYVKDFL